MGYRIILQTAKTTVQRQNLCRPVRKCRTNLNLVFAYCHITADVYQKQGKITLAHVKPGGISEIKPGCKN